MKRHLRERGIAAEVHYPIPDHRQPALVQRFRDVHLPVTERACEQVLSLPCFPEMTDEEAAHVIEACCEWKV